MVALLYWGTIALLVLLAYLTLDIMGFLSRRDKFQVEGRTVLLTGGSYGMGREIARLLSERGANLIIVARDLTKLRAALEYAKSHAKNPSSQRFHVISADVIQESENERMLAEATVWNNGVVPEIVWANAGASRPALFLDSSMETLRKQMDMNYWAGAYLAHKTLKAWLYPDTSYKPLEKGAKAEAPRHLVITASSLAFVNVAGYAPYAPAKAALRSLCDALRMEVLLYNGARRSTKVTSVVPAPFDVNIQMVFPGTIDSPGLKNENKTKHPLTLTLEDSDPVQSEKEAALTAVQGLENGNFQTTTNWLGHLMRFSTMAGSKRDNIVRDTVGMWLTSFLWLFIGPDMDNKSWSWGKKQGMPERKVDE